MNKFIFLFLLIVIDQQGTSQNDTLLDCKQRFFPNNTSLCINYRYQPLDSNTKYCDRTLYFPILSTSDSSLMRTLNYLFQKHIDVMPCQEAIAEEEDSLFRANYGSDMLSGTINVHEITDSLVSFGFGSSAHYAGGSYIEWEETKYLYNYKTGINLVEKHLFKQDSLSKSKLDSITNPSRPKNEKTPIPPRQYYIRHNKIVVYYDRQVALRYNIWDENLELGYEDLKTVLRKNSPITRYLKHTTK